MQFRDASYTGNENDGQISAIVYRSGDLSYRSTVRCYSRQGSAQVMMDFNERPNTDVSTIVFLPGTICGYFWKDSLLKKKNHETQKENFEDVQESAKFSCYISQ